MLLSVLALVIGVLAYGIAGARLSDGAQSEGGALASPAWWIGTACQGAGFVFTLFECLVIVLQAYVFTLLTAVYIDGALSAEH